jgi:D-3-phosphoglycerate dehydrogenase / 2-oxoglutarate reductase
MDAVPRPPTVLITASRACRDIDQYRAALGPLGCEIVTHPAVERLEEADLLAIVADADVVICGDDRFTARVIESAPRLKAVVKWGTGVDSIDRVAAARRGVEVCNTPDAFSEPVADSVFGYILLFARQLEGMTADMRAGRWLHLPLKALNDCTLGIVGLGHIGAAVARRAAAFRMRTLAFDVRPIDDEASALGVQPASLEQVLAESDFVSLHADLRADNRYLMNAARLAQMRPTAVLINTARGPLVDEAALASALRDGRLAGAALDVFEYEPLPAESALRTLPNLHLAPHNANSSPAATERVHANTIRHVTRLLASALP